MDWKGCDIVKFSAEAEFKVFVLYYCICFSVDEMLDLYFRLVDLVGQENVL